MNGQDKFLLPLGGKKMLSHIIDRLSPQVDKLILNINGPAQRASFFQLEVVSDIIYDEMNKPLGPLGGLYTALQYAKDNDFDYVVTTPCDTPFLPQNYVEKLWQHYQDNAVVVAKSKDRLHPVLALWSVSLLDDLKLTLEKNDRKMMDWLKKHHAKEVVWDEKLDPFININNLEDLKEAEKQFY